MANFRSLLSKQDELAGTIVSCSPEVIIGTETWLSDTTPNSGLLLNKNFNIFRKDRATKRGGGVIIAVLRGITCTVLPLDSPLETLWVSISGVSFQNVIVGVCYRPPDSTGEFVNELTNIFEHIQSKYPRSVIILAGDFNYPGIDWANLNVCTTCSRKEESSSFVNLLNSFSIKQVVNQPTRGDAVLDLVCTSHPKNMSVRVIDEISDHRLVYFSYNAVRTTRVDMRKVIYDYSKANSGAIEDSLLNFLAQYLSRCHACSVEDNWTFIKNELILIRENFIPKLVITQSENCPWFSRSVKRVISKKKRLFRNARFSGTEHAWQLYEECARLCKNEIRKAKDTFF